MHTMEYNPESWVQKRAPEQPGLALAMAYVPIQPWEKPYEADVGLVRGTIFPSLDKPFIGEGACSHG